MGPVAAELRRLRDTDHQVAPPHRGAGAHWLGYNRHRILGGRRSFRSEFRLVPLAAYSCKSLPVSNLSSWLQWGAMLAGAGVALLVVSVLVWTARDAASRTSSRALQLGAVLLVLLLNLLGLVVYVLLRSPETRSERREREIIEAILAREATGQLARPKA